MLYLDSSISCTSTKIISSSAANTRFVGSRLNFSNSLFDTSTVYNGCKDRISPCYMAVSTATVSIIAESVCSFLLLLSLTMLCYHIIQQDIYWQQIQ